MSSIFTHTAKKALLAIEVNEERVDTILFLLQTAIYEEDPIIRYQDVRSAQLMLELGVHLFD